MSNKVYTANWNTTIAAANSAVGAFAIQSVGREIKIKSITLAWYMAIQGTNMPKPWRSNSDQIFALYVGDFANKFSSAFTNFTGVAPAATGNQLIIFEPGQWLFDSFFIPNLLPFNWSLTNLSAVGVDHSLCITVETEEHTMFL